MKILYGIILFLFLGFSSVFGNYERNINDEYAIYQLDLRLGNILDKYENQDEIKKQVRQILKKRLGKTHDELIPNWKSARPVFLTQKEYVYYKVYLYLYYGDGLEYLQKDSDLKILENDYIRIISKASELNIDKKSVHGLYRDKSLREDYIYFFATNKNKTLSEYVSESIFEEKYEGKCQFKEYNGNFIFTDNQVFSFQANENYSKEFGFKETPDCGEFTHGYFERKSDNLIIFVKFTYEYVGLDYSLIEIK